MMATRNYWEDSMAHSVPVKYEILNNGPCKDEVYRTNLNAGHCEGNLNFATASEDDDIYIKKKVSRQDPMSHRIIEKRRRDRMNNCLADLSRLIPAEYLKKGRGRVEKTEIIEMAIRHMKYLQETKLPSDMPIQNHPEDSEDSTSHSTVASNAVDHYRLGFQECLSETIHFLIEVEGYFARDSLCVQLINHLQQHCEKILATSDRLGFPHPEIPALNASTFHHSSIPTMCSVNGQSDKGSSSGLSSFGESERRLQTIGPPMILSDDSNHSNHSSQSYTNLSSVINKPPNYKFKSSIKQRFSEERIKTNSPTYHSKKSHGVPIFALHDAGAFYIPLTIESSILRHHLTCVPDTGTDTVLHPVTISVNFTHQSQPSWINQNVPYQQ